MTHLYFEGEARPERVKRLQRRRRRIITVTVLTAALVVALGARAWAWHIGVNGHANCVPTAQPRLSTDVSITVPDEPWAAGSTAGGTVSLAGQSKSWAKVGAGTTSVSFPGVNGGTATVSGEFNTGEPASGSKTIAAIADCEPEQTTTTTTTPDTTTSTTAPPDTTTPDDNGDDFAGTATDQTRTPSDDVEEEVTVPPPSTPTPGQLPFTGPREDMQRAMLLGGLALVLAGVALVVTMRRKPAVAVEQGWGETRVRPDRDSADANLLATLFGRRSR